MNYKSLRLVAVVGALLVAACFAASANAQCCGGGGWGGWGTTANYAPSYSTYDTGWYPGYWWDRVSARLWGSPNTYVASYPGYYTAGYSGYYSAGYGGYSGCSTCGGCSTCASYAPCSSCSTCASPCSSCSTCASPCSSCSTCSAGYAPCSSCSTCNSGYVTSYAPSCGCSTCGASCPSNCGCSGCAAGSGVNQVSYPQQPGCNCGSNGTQIKTYVDPNETGGKAPTQVLQNGASGQSSATGSGKLEPKPEITNRPPVEVNAPTNGAQPGPGSDSDSKTGPYDEKKTDSGASFEPPALFNPKDRQARNTSIAPVRTAVYEQPVSYRPTSTAPRAANADEQVRRDAIGWTSGTN